MITSPKAKAIIAAIITVLVGVLGQLANVVWVNGDAHNYVTVALGIITAVGTTFGVYQVQNTSV